MKTIAQTFVTESAEKLKTYRTNFSNAYQELIDASVRFFDAIMKFVFHVIISIVAVITLPAFGILMLALYLWGEMKLGETLSMRWRIVFWVITIPLALAQWIVFTHTLIHFAEL